MTMEQAVKSAFGAMDPLPEAEDRIWQSIDEKLGGKARQMQIGVRRRRRTPWKGFVLASAAVLALLAVSFAVLQRMNEVTGEPIPAEEAEATPTPTPEPTPTPPLIPETRMIELVNAQVNDSSIFSLSEEGSFLARAVLSEGQCVDHWEVNGETADPGQRRYSLEFESEGVQKIEAVLREERRVTCVNCYLQFLDADGNPAGWMYEDVCFEYYYTEPASGHTHPGGSITAVVLPIDPDAEQPAYWLIDGEVVWEGEGHGPASEIRLIDLDRSIHIELVYEHGYRKVEMEEPVVITGGGSTEELYTRSKDDLPAGAKDFPPKNWIEVDYLRDGVPLDPDSPGRDGHTHQWTVDASASRDSTCLENGKYVHVCSVCGGKYVTWEPVGRHHYIYETNPEYHRLICRDCGDLYDDWTPHRWRYDSYLGCEICDICGLRR